MRVRSAWLGDPIHDPYRRSHMRFLENGAPALLWLSIGLAQPAPLDGQNEDVLAYTGVVAAGVGVLAVGVFDIATASESARRYNDRAVALKPVFDPVARRYGLGFSFSVGKSADRRVIGSSELRSERRGGPPGVHGLRRRAPPRGVKSPASATLWSLGATLIPSGLGLAIGGGGGWNDNQTTLWIGVAGLASGWLFGPGAGHWYAEQHGRAWTTTGLRLGLTVLGLLALSTVSFD